MGDAPDSSNRAGDFAARGDSPARQNENESPDALVNLGTVMLRQGNWAAATDVFTRAAKLLPDSADVHDRLGQALRMQRRLAEAIEHFRRAIELLPDSADLYNNLADALQESGRLPDALTAYRQALVLKPDFVAASYNLATALQESGQLDDAIAAYRQTIQLAPSLPEAYNMLGNALGAAGRTDESIASYREALRLRPNYVEVLHNLGLALFAQRRFDEAAAATRRAVELRPDFAEAIHSLGSTFERLGRYDEAAALHERAISLRPQFPEALNSLAWNCYQRGMLAEARELFDRALSLRPDFAEARFSRAQLLLSQGDYQNGLVEYEHRWEASRRSMNRGFSQPLWDGSELQGRTILLHAEQGLGDVIQFVRYVPMVRARGGRVVVKCWAPLKRLLTGQLGIEQVCTEKESAPQFDVHFPIGSLPRLFGTKLDSIPANVPYLVTDPTLVEQWGGRLAGDPPGYRIGLVWAGNPEHSNDHLRSTRLSTFAPLATVPNVRLYSLQTGPGAEEASVPGTGMAIRTFAEGVGDMASTAALMSNLDLVITVDTSAGHLAGAIGRPTWLLLHLVPDWRWMLGRADSAWYPTLRLYRQTRLGDWSTPVAQMQHELRVIAEW